MEILNYFIIYLVGSTLLAIAMGHWLAQASSEQFVEQEAPQD